MMSYFERIMDTYNDTDANENCPVGDSCPSIPSHRSRSAHKEDQRPRPPGEVHPPRPHLHTAHLVGARLLAACRADASLIQSIWFKKVKVFGRNN
jgi:hypothetical protein